MAKRKRTTNDVQNMAHKTKDRVTRIPLKTGGEFRCSGRVSRFRSNRGIHRVNLVTRRVWSQQRGNQIPNIEEEQTTQWPKEKVQKDKQWSTKHTHNTKDRVKRTPLKSRGKLRCSVRAGSSRSTSGTRHVNLVTNSVISHEWGKGREVFTINGTYLLYADAVFDSG